MSWIDWIFIFVPLSNPVSLVTNHMVLEKWLRFFFFDVYIIRRYITTFVELLFGTPSRPADFIQLRHKVKLGSISWVICSHLLSRAHISTSNYDVTEFEGMWTKLVVRHFKELSGYLSGGNL